MYTVSVQPLSSTQEPHPVGGALPPHVVREDQASMYQNVAASDATLAPWTEIETVTYFLPPWRMPDAEVTQTISCVSLVRFLEDLMAQANGPKVTEIDAGSKEKNLPVMVTSVPPAVDPSTGTTEDTCGVNAVRAVKTADWLRFEAETEVVCVT